MRQVNFIDVPSIEKARLRNSESATLVYEESNLDYLKKFYSNKLFYIKTYGCQANVRDEETMAGLLSSIGMKRTEDRELASVAILNTCAVRENAEDKVYGEIGEFKTIKSKNKNLVLLICGCMIEQKHIIDKILETYTHVDIMFGTHNIHNILKLIDVYTHNKKIRLVDVSSKVGDIIENLPSVRNSNYKAFVNISYGCNKFCTYCIVPYTRGKERSRDFNDILKECKQLVDAGYQEITLLGQNVDSYGKDLSNGVTFAKLLEEVAKLGIPRLRFLTSYPSDFSDDVIEVMAKYPNIMKYLHLPLQAGNDNVLRNMGRRYDSTTYLKLVDRIRNKIPNIALSTDIIVGFPNETYEEFLDTVKICQKVKYASAFTFIYSPRKGTPAAKLVDNVTYKEKNERFQELVKAMEVYFKEYADSLVGTVQNVLVEGPSKKNKDLLSGYTESNKVVHFKGDGCLTGRIIKVRITGSHVYSLVGEIVNE